MSPVRFTISMSSNATRCVRIRAVICALMLALAPGAASSADIHAVVRAGDAAGVKAALESGADVNTRDAWGRTPLIVAIQQNRMPVVELLVQRGADVAATDAWGRTPLLVATQLKNSAAIRLLIERKADVDVANRNDITPLIAAAQTGNGDAVALLIQAKAALDRQDNLGWTALMWAASRRNEAIVKALLDAGADAAKSGWDGATALDLAQRSGADAPLVALLAARTPASTARAATRAAPPPKAIVGPKLAPSFDPARIVRGNPNAPITIFEYTDFQCPYCAHGARTIDEVMARYEGQVRLVVKNLPLPLLHPMALPAAQYFEAIALQDPAKAWAFYDRVFKEQRALAGGESHLQKLATELGVDAARLAQDVRGETVRARIAADLKEAERFRFDGVPVFVVQGNVIAGARPAQDFFDVIDALVRQ